VLFVGAGDVDVPVAPPVLPVSFVVSPATPTVQRLQIAVFIWVLGSTPTINSLTGRGITWALALRHNLYGGGGIEYWYGVAVSPTSAPMVPVWSATPGVVYSYVIEATGAALGNNGADAIGNSGIDSGNQGGATVSPIYTNTNSRVLTAIHVAGDGGNPAISSHPGTALVGPATISEPATGQFQAHGIDWLPTQTSGLLWIFSSSPGLHNFRQAWLEILAASSAIAPTHLAVTVTLFAPALRSKVTATPLSVAVTLYPPTITTAGAQVVVAAHLSVTATLYPPSIVFTANVVLPTHLAVPVTCHPPSVSTGVIAAHLSVSVTLYGPSVRSTPLPTVRSTATVSDAALHTAVAADKALHTASVVDRGLHDSQA
jgi:hypothetical protein